MATATWNAELGRFEFPKVEKGEKSTAEHKAKEKVNVGFSIDEVKGIMALAREDGATVTDSDIENGYSKTRELLSLYVKQAVAQMKAGRKTAKQNPAPAKK